MSRAPRTALKLLKELLEPRLLVVPKSWPRFELPFIRVRRGFFEFCSCYTYITTGQSKSVSDGIDFMASEAGRGNGVTERE